MSVQAKLIEAASDFRNRADALRCAALVNTRRRARQALDGSRQLKAPVSALHAAGGEFRKMASRHLSQFVAQNSSWAREAGRDVLQLARMTYSNLASGPVPAPRKPAARRSRAPAAARQRRAAKLA